MIGLVRAVRPLVRASQGGKSAIKARSAKPKTLKSIYGRQEAHLRSKRYYSNGTAPGEEAPSPIVTVDKWGVQREADEVGKSNQGKTSYTHGAPATEMAVFELTKHNFQETLQSQAPVIIMAYLPSSDLSIKLDEHLQRRVSELGGAVRLGRLNASVEQELAVALKLTQLPTVLGVYGGRMVSSFIGLPEEKVLEEFVDLMLRVGGQTQLVEMYGRANGLLESGSVEEAQAVFQEILGDRMLKAEALALAGLVRCAIKQGKIEEAQELADIIRQSYPKDAHAPEVQQAFTALELSAGNSASSSTEIGETVKQLKEKIAANINDHESRLALSQALWASSQQTEAIQVLLDSIKIDKQWNEQAARKLLLKYWESLGPDHPLTATSRKRFGVIWF